MTITDFELRSLHYAARFIEIVRDFDCYKPYFALSSTTKSADFNIFDEDLRIIRSHTFWADDSAFYDENGQEQMEAFLFELEHYGIYPPQAEDIIESYNDRRGV